MNRFLKAAADLASISFWVSFGWSCNNWMDGVADWNVFIWSMVSLAVYWSAGLWLMIRVVRQQHARLRGITPEQIQRAAKTLRNPEE